VTVPLIVCSLVCEEVHIMATNLAIDPELLERALAIGGEKTKKATVTVALEEYIARRAQAEIVKHFGTLEWDEDYDYKESRRTRDRKLGLIDE
jgi:Arc/MetJ family transcription regulator